MRKVNTYLDWLFEFNLRAKRKQTFVSAKSRVPESYNRRLNGTYEDRVKILNLQQY